VIPVKVNPVKIPLASKERTYGIVGYDSLSNRAQTELHWWRGLDSNERLTRL
jgi:hypothetical protein